MAEQVERVTVKVTLEMAHEQVLKLRCEYDLARGNAYYLLARGHFRPAAQYAIEAIKTKAQLRRIARWL